MTIGYIAGRVRYFAKLFNTSNDVVSFVAVCSFVSATTLKLRVIFKMIFVTGVETINNALRFADFGSDLSPGITKITFKNVLAVTYDTIRYDGLY